MGTAQGRKAELFTPEPALCAGSRVPSQGAGTRRTGMPKRRRKRVCDPVKVQWPLGRRWDRLAALEKLKGEVTHRTAVSALSFVMVSSCGVERKQSSQ